MADSSASPWGFLFAPKSGKETREDIARKTSDVLDKAKEEYEKAAEKAKLIYEASLNDLKEFNAKDKRKSRRVREQGE